jgi:DNA-binding CsgD family transcriptional regulator
VRATGAELILEEMVRLRGAGLDTHAYCGAAGGRIRALVPHDGSCGYTIDPATMLITSHVSENLPASFSLLALKNEYLSDDLNKFADLARRREPVAVLGRTTRGRPQRSARYRELLAPNGLGPELRVSFVARGACWGSLTLVREQGKPDFDERDIAFFSAASRSIAEGLRSAMAIAAAVRDELPGAPGLILVNRRSELERANATAAHWLGELGAPGAAAGDAPLPVVVVSAATAALIRDRPPRPEALRVRGRSGGWISVSGARLSGQPPLASVLIQAAGATEVAPLILEAYDLTPREREVAEQVLRNRSTAEVAATLFISPYTVQDHLKAVFDKAGVRNRKELFRRVFLDHYLPHIQANCPPAADGRPRST